MAIKKKRKKEVILIEKEIDLSRLDDVDDCPKCYNEKNEYCRKDLCGEWFNSCRPDIPF